jgi:hypothetical protein
VICRQFDERYTAHLLANTAHVLLCTLCQLRSMSNPTLLQFCILRLQYPFEYISAAFGDMSTIQCALHTAFADKYSARHPVEAVSTLCSVQSSVFAV